MERHFLDGHTETWWAADARLGGYGPDSPCRLVVATTDPAGLPEKATWYLATNLPHPDAPHAATGPHPPTGLAEIVRDLGWKDEEGYLYISDRRVDMIVSGGANIYPAEVENAIDQHPKVLSSVVVGLPDDDLGQRAHAIVQAEPGTTARELLDFLVDRLVRYKIPRSVEFTDQPLRDDSGKVRRSRLRGAAIERVKTRA